MNRKTNLIFGGLSVAFGIYVIIRAWLIPVTLDECTTAIMHVPRSAMDTLFFIHEAYPNNHILNTLLIKGITGIFGWHPFVIRIPALIGAGIYVWASVLLCRQISAQLWVRVFAFTMLLGQPFLLEFFSLARGYALGLGLMLAAIWQGWRFLNESRWESLLPAVIFAGLAIYANFTQTIFFVPFVGLLFFCGWQASGSIKSFWQKSKAAIIAVGVFAALLFSPLKKLAHHSELVNWQSLGSFFDSFQLSSRAAIYNNTYLGRETDVWLTWLATIFTLGIIAVAIWRSALIQGRFSADPRLFFVALFAGVMATNVIQVQLTHTPYLQPRLALLYWPLFTLSLGTAAAWLWERANRWAWVFMVPLFTLMLINMVQNANLRKTSEWWHDEYTYLIFDYLKKSQESEGRTEPFSLDCHWLLQNSLIYHIERDPRGFNLAAKLAPWHDVRPATREYEFYYALNQEDANPILDAYEVVLRVPKNSMMLLRKKKQ
ncbi:MAG: hypothetical protein ACKVU0_08335 [Saprospiraceae bacterium]